MEVDYLQVSLERMKKLLTNWPPVNTAHLKASVNETINIRGSIEWSHLLL